MVQSLVFRHKDGLILSEEHEGLQMLFLARRLQGSLCLTAFTEQVCNDRTLKNMKFVLDPCTACTYPFITSSPAPPSHFYSQPVARKTILRKSYLQIIRSNRCILSVERMRIQVWVQCSVCLEFRCSRIRIGDGVLESCHFLGYKISSLHGTIDVFPHTLV